MMLLINKLMEGNCTSVTAITADYSGIKFETLTEPELIEVILDNRVRVFGAEMEQGNIKYDKAIGMCSIGDMADMDFYISINRDDVATLLLRLLELCDDFYVIHNINMIFVHRIRVNKVTETIVLNGNSNQELYHDELTLRWKQDGLSKQLKSEFPPNEMFTIEESGVILRAGALTGFNAKGLKGDVWLTDLALNVFETWRENIKEYISAYNTLCVFNKQYAESEKIVLVEAESEYSARGRQDFEEYEKLFPKHKRNDNYKFRKAVREYSQLELLSSIVS